MGFLAGVIQALIKMVFIGAVSFGGIKLGQYLRKRKNEKEADKAEN